MPKVVGLIPVRMESTRLPRKALVDICGLPMILHVYKRCLLSKSLEEVFVVTDSKEICALVETAGGQVIMTRSDHQTGTDRLAEAAQYIECDTIVNIQGDEALVNPQHIDVAVSEFTKYALAKCAILVSPIKAYNVSSYIKAVLNQKNEIMYLSRSDIPSGARENEPLMWKAYHIVPFQKNFLIEYTKWPKGKLEKIEFNEYLRILEKGEKILGIPVESTAVSVDTPLELEYVRKKMPTDPFFKLYSGEWRNEVNAFGQI